MKSYLNIPFKRVENHELSIDLYIPEDVQNPPIIMWIHGGAWCELNRKWCLVMPQVQRGYAVCSVDYRYSDEAPFPAQMYDLKDALQFVKKNGEVYGYDSSKIIVSGDSAGAHLCNLLGVSAGNKDWESMEGDYKVQAVVDFCGPTEFIDKIGDDLESNAIVLKLLGADVSTKQGKSRAANAVPFPFIDGTEPPFLIIHGSVDPTVSPDNSRKLRNALEEAGVPVHMYLVPGGVHGLSGTLVDEIIQEFLDYYIKKKTTVITPELRPCHDRTVPRVDTDK